MGWMETSGLERDILLSVHRKSKSVSEISRGLEKSIQTISKTIERMNEQDLIIKIHEYGKDARKTEIQINKERIKIEKLHTFYLAYFVLAFVPFVISLVFSLILKKYFLVIGCAIGVSPPLAFMIYNSYIKEDKVIVEKNSKIKK